MSDAPLISVLMPAYNSELYIAEAIESILSQTLRNFELIIYDDGSVDNTRKIIQEFSDPRIVKIFSDINLGVVSARNNMLDIARGQYIALMDSDDLADARRFEKQINEIIENGLDICGSSQFVLNQKTGRVKKSLDKFNDSDLRALLTVYCPLCNSTVIGKAYIFKEMRYDASFMTSEDYYLWARIAASGYIFGNLKDRLITYRVYPEQATALYPKRFKDSTKLVQTRYLELLGLSVDLQPRKLSLIERFPRGIRLLCCLKDRFSMMSFAVGCEIYSRFQKKNGLVRSMFLRLERLLVVSIAFCFNRLIFPASIFLKNH